MKEADIVFDAGTHWVYRDSKKQCYTVFAVGATHSTSDSSYALSDDGLSIAVARCKYLAKRKSN